MNNSMSENTHTGTKMLADEYKKLAENELPDLWDRIEAGIAEKTVAATSEKAGGKAVKTVTAVDFPVENVKTVKLEQASYQNRYRFARRYGGLLVACLCVAVLVPVIYFNRDAAKQFAANDSAGTTAPAAAPAPEAALHSEADEAPSGGITNDMAAGAVWEEAEASEEAAPAPSYDMEKAAEEYGFMTDNGIQTDGEDRNVSGEAAKARLFRTEPAEEIMEITKVTIEITGFSAEGFGQDLPDVYTAVVFADEADALFTGISISLRKNEGLAAEIAVGETYLADLSYRETAPYFTIIKIY
jgi:hypothetical protein